ncbi:hypothetical protein HBI42_212890 [Parastagonospora nodorum]|nr:hypothetical protein HBI79_167620 [Parastagonospora nodorum]KAH5295836.1 hypothetical protein HBI12_215520 [Parastagonospora nodorum]KAH5409943.1 hypothetical protein HBI47_163450 [Parastagonospora nodorum]KAH6208702.1 hypothetical protein HBI43_176630 [Parastagonospora nodorum]KAH6243845.1 hypothetical protein HBI42_212890 [Parastagonospora nodorum]
MWCSRSSYNVNKSNLSYVCIQTGIKLPGIACKLVRDTAEARIVCFPKSTGSNITESATKKSFRQYSYNPDRYHKANQLNINGRRVASLMVPKRATT